MNREIKFRGQQINTKKWVYGYLYRNKGLYVICENIRYAEEEPIFLDTVGQYTGLHDKNGKEIYEGDVVLYKDWEMAYEGGGNDSFINKGIVEYCEDNCCFNVTERQTVDLADVLYKDNEDLEVIGNIYDNPELLGGE